MTKSVGDGVGGRESSRF